MDPVGPALLDVLGKVDDTEASIWCRKLYNPDLRKRERIMLLMAPSYENMAKVLF